MVSHSQIHCPFGKNDIITWRYRTLAIFPHQRANFVLQGMRIYRHDLATRKYGSLIKWRWWRFATVKLYLATTSMQAEDLELSRVSPRQVNLLHKRARVRSMKIKKDMRSVYCNLVVANCTRTTIKFLCDRQK